MGLKFTKFSSIENSYRKKYLEILEEHDYTDKDYVVKEKIDGANFAFYTDGITVKVASRTQFVDGGFYNCQDVIDRYSNIIMELKRERFPSNEQIAVYGELAGAGIQNRVYYGKHKDFFAFEIKADKETLSQCEMEHKLHNIDIPQAPIIAVCKNLEDALLVSNEFESEVYKSAYGYEGGEYDKPNICEGVVIQPYLEPIWTGNGARVLIKNKNEKFAEKGKKKKTRNKSVNPHIATVEQFVNLNRMLAVTSKFGVVEPKDFGQIIKLMNIDVIEDMIKDEEIPEDWKKHEDYKTNFGKAVGTVVSKFLKENLLKDI